MFYVGSTFVEGSHPLRGWTFAVPLLVILVVHEFGHYVFARHHHVDASLPYFLPFPYGLLGTFGAIITMRGRIKTKNALLDIGAAGPLAGLIVAIPILIIGLRLSPIKPIGTGELVEGQSLFYLAIKRIVVGPIPQNHDVFLHPTAFAGWAGLLMTMFNLVPVGQLDGGHVAYALFGEKQNRYSRWVRTSLLFVALIVGVFSAFYMYRIQPSWSAIGWALSEGKIWLFWWFVLWLMTRGDRAEHPPTDVSVLSKRRQFIAWITLILFVLLFMPKPLSVR